jgi:ectoine hydroxylase-related dioxygenase (phytanoyl-CoA dioxygenase family)
MLITESMPERFCNGTRLDPSPRADFENGGLMVLEGSNRNEKLRNTYCTLDVDTYCTNRPPESKSAKGPWSKTGGYLTRNINQLRGSLGGRWVTTEYEPGDLLLFTIFTVHASTDNRSNRVRLSTDTRYQLASEPKDERWIGEHPVAHGQAGGRGRVC